MRVLDIPLIFEAGRIAAKLTDCVMYNPFPEMSAGVQLPLSKLVSGYLNGHYTLKELYGYVERLEKWACREVEFRTPEQLSALVELTAIPFCFLLNRIISSQRLIFAPEMQFYIVRQEKEKAVLKMLQKMRNAEVSAIKKVDARKISRINEIEGLLLGYPECCVSSFIKLKKERAEGKNIPSPERVIAEEFIKYGLASFTEEAIKGKFRRLPEEGYSLFATNFYPCSLKCANAIEMGKSYSRFLDDIAENVFLSGVIANLASVLVVCVEMGLYHTDVVKEFKRDASFHGQVMAKVYGLLS